MESIPARTCRALRRASLALAVVLASGTEGCASRAITLYTMQSLEGVGGEQRVYPYFIDQPMVIAFWDVDSIQSIEALPGLNTLARRDGPVHLVSVCVSKDRTRINKWIFREKVLFEVIHDPDERLARTLGVDSYPTYVFFDRSGREIDRRLEIQTVQNWFDRERWHRRADPSSTEFDGREIGDDIEKYAEPLPASGQEESE
jgi:hypothetical protein